MDLLKNSRRVVFAKSDRKSAPLQTEIRGVVVSPSMFLFSPKSRYKIFVTREEKHSKSA